TGFSFLLVDVLDTAAAVVGAAHRAGLANPGGAQPRAKRLVAADSTATMAGALLGTSTGTSYIESAAGVRAGGRTGLVAVTVALMFLLALFLSPLAGPVPPSAPPPAALFVPRPLARVLTAVGCGG